MFNRRSLSWSCNTFKLCCYFTPSSINCKTYFITCIFFFKCYLHCNILCDFNAQTFCTICASRNFHSSLISPYINFVLFIARSCYKNHNWIMINNCITIYWNTINFCFQLSPIAFHSKCYSMFVNFKYHFHINIRIELHCHWNVSWITSMIRLHAPVPMMAFASGISSSNCCP